MVRKIKQLQAEISKGLPPPDDRTTVEQLLHRWLRDVLPGRVNPATLENYRLIAEHHIIPELGRKKLAALSPADVQALLRRKQETRLPRHVRTGDGLVVRDTVAGGYSRPDGQAHSSGARPGARPGGAMGDGRRNVVRLTDGPRDPKTEGRTLTPEQARSLLQAASGERLEAAFVVMLSLGLRRGEVFGLRWADIDFESNVITVAQTLSRVGSRLVFGPPKTERAAGRSTFRLRWQPHSGCTRSARQPSGSWLVNPGRTLAWFSRARLARHSIQRTSDTRSTAFL